MSLLGKILGEMQSSAIDTGVDIEVVLRKCKVLAAKLGSEDFKLWVEHELNGYQSIQELPDYRIIKNVQSYGNFITTGWRRENTAIPTSRIPAEYRDSLTTVYLTEPISYISSLVNQKHGEPTINLHWSGDLVTHLSDKLLPDWSLTSAWRVIATSSLVALLDTVRNRILSFVLEIQKEVPSAGEAPSDQEPTANERVKQVFNTYIMGGTTQIVAGDQTIKGNIAIHQVIQDDFDSLKRFLSSLGVSEDDIRELTEAIKQDKKCRKEAWCGNRVQTWLGKMICKAADGSWRIATYVAANLLTDALKRYLGI